MRGVFKKLKLPILHVVSLASPFFQNVHSNVGICSCEKWVYSQCISIKKHQVLRLWAKNKLLSWSVLFVLVFPEVLRVLQLQLCTCIQKYTVDYKIFQSSPQGKILHRSSFAAGDILNSNLQESDVNRKLAQPYDWVSLMSSMIFRKVYSWEQLRYQHIILSWVFSRITKLCGCYSRGAVNFLWDNKQFYLIC